LDLIRRRDFTHRIGGKPWIDAIAARRVIALRAVSAPPRTGIRHDKLDFVQVFQIWIVHDCPSICRILAFIISFFLKNSKKNHGVSSRLGIKQ
jgi:hypothetical protein